jgi:hypothetical protein
LLLRGGYLFLAAFGLLGWVIAKHPHFEHGVAFEQLARSPAENSVAPGPLLHQSFHQRGLQEHLETLVCRADELRSGVETTVGIADA